MTFQNVDKAYKIRYNNRNGKGAERESTVAFAFFRY